MWSQLQCANPLPRWRWYKWHHKITCFFFFEWAYILILIVFYPENYHPSMYYMKMIGDITWASSPGILILQNFKETQIPNFLCLTYSRNWCASNYKWQDNGMLSLLFSEYYTFILQSRAQMPHFMLLVGTFRVFHPSTAKLWWNGHLQEEMKGISEHEIYRNWDTIKH